MSLLQWNIERGYQLAGIIEELRRLDADVLALQEVDVGCDRSGGVDTGGLFQPLLLMVFALTGAPSAVACPHLSVCLSVYVTAWP